MGVRSPPALPGYLFMDQLEMEEILASKMELEKKLADHRQDQARKRAAARCMLRDDCVSVVIRPDGTLLCTDDEGREVLRPAGWRARS